MKSPSGSGQDGAAFHDLLKEVMPALSEVFSCQGIPAREAEALLDDSLTMLYSHASSISDPTRWLVAAISPRCARFEEA